MRPQGGVGADQVAAAAVDIVGQRCATGVRLTQNPWQTVAEIAKTSNYQGSLGSTSFDKNGDTNVKIISIYKYDSTDPAKANDEPWVAQINYGQATPTIQTS